MIESLQQRRPKSPFLQWPLQPKLPQLLQAPQPGAAERQPAPPQPGAAERQLGLQPELQAAAAAGSHAAAAAAGSHAAVMQPDAANV